MESDSNVINFRTERLKRSIKRRLISIISYIAGFFYDKDRKVPGHRKKGSKNRAVSKRRKVY